MIYQKIIILIILVSITGCEKHKSEWSLAEERTWLENKGLLNPESILYDDKNDVLYITNGEDYNLSTDGFISKIDSKGNLIELRWVDGLNRPTGMALFEGLLYVADFNRLLVIHTGSGAVLKSFQAPVPNPGLNDVCIDNNGNVYVSASFEHSVFKLENEGLKKWISDDLSLQWANGLEAQEEHILVAGMNLSKINIRTDKIEQIEMNPNIQDFDGIAYDGDGGFFLSTVGQSGLYFMNSNGMVRQVDRSRPYFGNLEFVKSKNKLYVPRGNKTTKEYFISVYSLE